MSKQILIESIRVEPGEPIKIPLAESTYLKESDGKEYECIGAYTFPVSRPNETNLNGRVYTTPLWERVIKLGQGIGAFGLTDHPTNEGSVKDAFCVWRNPRLSNDGKLVLVDAYLFGTWGQHAQDAIKAGGLIGLSSVGYGEFLADGITINPDTFELVRFADWVLNPSYEVFGNGDTPVITTSKTIENKVLENEEKLPSGIKSEDVNKEEKSMKKSIEEKTFRLQMEGMLKDIKKESDLTAKKTSLLEGLTFFEGEESYKDLIEKFDTELNVVEESINALTEKGKSLDRVSEEKEEAEKSIEILEDQIEGLNGEKIKLLKTAEEATGLSESLKVVVIETRKQAENFEDKIKTMFTADEVSKIKEDYEAKMKTMFTAEEVLKIKEAKEKEEPKEEPKEDPKDDSKEEPKDEKKEHIDSSVLAYYETLRDAHPAVVKIKEELLRCKTLVEAQKKFMSLKSVVFESSYVRSPLLTKEVITEEVVKVAPRVLPRVKESSSVRPGWV